MKAITMKQAIEIGFDFEAFDNNSTLAEIEQAMVEYLNENVEQLPTEEDECEVTTGGRSQNVNHGDFTSSGEIVNFSEHWSKDPSEKVFHSNYLHIGKEGKAVNMCLYYLVGETEYNAPAGYWYNPKLKRHVKEEQDEQE